MSVKNIVLYIVAGLVIFAVGGGVGVLYQQQKGNPLPEENPLIKTLSSNVVSLTASGDVEKIEGKNITLKLGDDALSVKMRDGVKFEDLKKGDFVTIFLSSDSKGTFEGYQVVVPSFNTK